MEIMSEMEIMASELARRCLDMWFLSCDARGWYCIAGCGQQKRCRLTHRPDFPLFLAQTRPSLNCITKLSPTKRARKRMGPGYNPRWKWVGGEEESLLILYIRRKLILHYDTFVATGLLSGDTLPYLHRTLLPFALS